MSVIIEGDGLTDKVIGSAYAVVKYVASNMETLIDLSESLDPLLEVAADLGTVADSIEDVKIVSDNITKVVSVADNIGPLLISSSSAYEALRRSYAEAGYNVVGTFRGGFTIVNANDVGIDEETGKGFTGPAGPVAAGTDPASGGFTDVSASYPKEFSLEQIGCGNGSDLADFVELAESLAVYGTTITCGNISIKTTRPAVLTKNGVKWDLNCEVDGASNPGVQMELAGKFIKVKFPRFKNSQYYDIYARPTSEHCLVSDSDSKNCKFTSYFDAGLNNRWKRLTGSDCGWDLVSNLGSRNSKWSECVATRPKRHGYSTDPTAINTTMTDCICIDNGGYLNEGSDAFHTEDDTAYSKNAVAHLVRCKATYTDSHRVLTDPTYKGLVRAFRSENVYLTHVEGLEVVAEPAIKAALAGNEMIFFGDSRTAPDTVLKPKTVIEDLKLDFGVVALGNQDAELIRPSGSFKIRKLGYGGRIDISDPQLDGSVAALTGDPLFSTAGGLAVIGCNIKGGVVANYRSVFDRVAQECTVDTDLSNVALPYEFANDTANASLSCHNVIARGRCYGNVTTFLTEHYQDADGFTADGIYFSGSIGTLRKGISSTSKWVGCDATSASVTTIEDITNGGPKVNLNAAARSPHDATLTTSNSAPTGIVPHSFGSTWVAVGIGYYVANGIDADSWVKLT